MVYGKKLKTTDMPSLLWLMLSLIILWGMVQKPEMVLRGATEGFEIWWKIILPALLPFFIIAHMLVELGFVKFLGYLMEPLMRPIFNVPGAGGYIMTMGVIGGAPINAFLTAQIRQEGLCTRIEAQRLVAFTNNCSLLFMLTAVGAGMFQRPDLGIVIAGSHYLANLILGVCLRFYGRNDPERKPYKQHWSLKSAFGMLLAHQRKYRHPLGHLIGRAVTSSMDKLLTIGGFIIFFAVIIAFTEGTGILNFIASGLGIILVPLGLSGNLLAPLSSGILETSIGTTLVSQANAVELHRVIAVSILLGWSGLSIHAQVASMLAKSDVGMGVFVISRIAHGILAGAITWLLYTPAVTASTWEIPLTTNPFLFMLGAMTAILTTLVILSLLLHLVLDWPAA